jgi:hypothetical protein
VWPYSAAEKTEARFGAGETPPQHENLPANFSVVSRRMPSGVAQGIEDLIEDRFRGSRIVFSDH